MSPTDIFGSVLTYCLDVTFDLIIFGPHCVLQAISRRPCAARWAQSSSAVRGWQTCSSTTSGSPVDMKPACCPWRKTLPCGSATFLVKHYLHTLTFCIIMSLFGHKLLFSLHIFSCFANSFETLASEWDHAAKKEKKLYKAPCLVFNII